VASAQHHSFFSPIFISIFGSARNNAPYAAAPHFAQIQSLNPRQRDAARKSHAIVAAQRSSVHNRQIPEIAIEELCAAFRCRKKLTSYFFVSR
jgi:hypothetical protein